MIKSLMVGLILLFGASKAQAVTDVAEVINSSFTVNMVSVSSSVATQMDPTATVMENRTAFEIHNSSTTGVLWCMHNATAASGTGRKIPAGGSWYLGLRARDHDSNRLTVYCINDSGTGPLSASVTQGRSK